jgi:hypothetical protein
MSVVVIYMLLDVIFEIVYRTVGLIWCWTCLILAAESVPSRYSYSKRYLAVSWYE